MFFTDFMSDKSRVLLHKSEHDLSYTPWSAEWDFSKPDEPISVILRCARCGREMLDLSDLSREQAVKVLQKDFLGPFKISKIVLPVKNGEHLTVLSCEACADSLSKGEDFDRIIFSYLCSWLRVQIGMGKDKKFLREGSQKIESSELAS